MKYFGTELGEKHKELARIIRSQDKTEQAKALFLDIHACLHLSPMAGGKTNEVDRLLGDLTDREYSVMPARGDETIAWVLWHTARIEDLTVNILAAGGGQVFDAGWKSELNAPITDTGNALTEDGMMELSKSLSIAALLRYRNEVGRKTRTTVQKLSADDMKRSVPRSGLDRILREGGVAEQEDSVWLLDFWGKKDVAGILLMPATRHVILHLNDCCKWKNAIRTKNRFYRS